MGYLFFGIIVSVEEKIWVFFEDNVFMKKLIKFFVLDLWCVSDFDYFVGEVFNIISRFLDNKGVVFVFSGVEVES